MSRKLDVDQYQRWFVDENNLSAGFADWVVEINFHIFQKENVTESTSLSAVYEPCPKWIVRFGEGSGGKWAHPIYCDTLEEAIELVDEYKEQIHFDKLMEKLLEDGNQPSDTLYSNNGI